MKYFLITVVFMAGATGWVYPVDLTLEEAIRLANENNNTLRAQRAETESADGTVLTGLSGLLPKIDAKLSYFVGEKGYSIISTIPANSFGTGLPPEDIRTSFSSADFTYDYTLGVTLTQPLFSGGKIWNGYRQTVLARAFQKERLRQTEDDIELQTKKAFYGAMLAKGFLQVAKEAYSLSQEHLRIARVRYNTGEATEFEVLRAEVDNANLRAQMIRAENAEGLALLALKDTIGLKGDERIVLIGSMEPRPFDRSLEECINTALAQRPEIRQLSYQKEMAKKASSIAKGAYLPNLALVGNYQSQTNKMHTSRLFDLPLNDWQESYSVMLVLSVPLFDGLYNYGKIREARAGLRRVSEIDEQVKSRIILEVKQVYASLEEARKIIEAGRMNVETANRAVEIAQAQYRNGLITSVELLSAEVGLTQAKTNYLQAQYDYTLALARLKKAMGSE